MPDYCNECPYFRDLTQKELERFKKRFNITPQKICGKHHTIVLLFDGRWIESPGKCKET